MRRMITNKELSEEVAKQIDTAGAVSVTGTQTITGQKTFAKPVKTSGVVNTSGLNEIADDGTNVTVGNSSRKLQLSGSATKPTYNGSELAFASETDNLQHTLMANLGIGRWANQTLLTFEYDGNKNMLLDDLSKQYTALHRYVAYTTLNSVNDNDLILFPDFGTTKRSANYFAYGYQSNGGIQLQNCYLDGNQMFCKAKFTSITVKDGCTAYLNGFDMFQSNDSLTSITGIDLTYYSETFAWGRNMFKNNSNLVEIKPVHVRGNIKLSKLTAFNTSEQLQGFFDGCDNLKELSLTSTIRLNSTQMNNLTAAQKAAMVDVKGWILELEE